MQVSGPDCAGPEVFARQSLDADADTARLPTASIRRRVIALHFISPDSCVMAAARDLRRTALGFFDWLE
jgi:hypothetical protein